MCSESSELTGGCLCGAVRFRGMAAGGTSHCHCEQCRRWSGEDQIAVALGCIDAPTGLTLDRHIFTAFKGDYYQIADGLPQDTGG